MAQPLFGGLINLMPATTQYDGTTSLEDFLYELEYECHSLDGPSQWIEVIYCHLAGEALEWANNDEEVARILYNAYHGVAIANDANKLNQLLEDRFVAPLSYRASILMGVKQGYHESIENYYIRIKTRFEHLGGQDKPIDQNHYLDYEHDCCLYEVIDWFVDGLRNNKLRRTMIETLQSLSAEDRATAVSLEATFNAAQWAYTTIKAARKLRNQLYTDDGIVIDMSRSCLEETSRHFQEISTAVDITNTASIASESVKWATASTSLQKPLSDTRIVDESPPVLVQIRPGISEISATTVDPSDTESTDEILASGPRKWPAPITTLSETIAVYESPPILEEITCDLSEISTDIEDSSDTESIDEILASRLRKWTTAAAAEKEVFDSTVTLHPTPKNPPAPRIGKDVEAVTAPDNACAESIVDVETLNQEVFALAAIYDAFSKSPPAPYSEDTEISAAVDMPSHEYLTHKDGSITEAFDSDTALGALSKNPSVQHTEDSETIEKNSAYIYELPALPAFDHDIDIDFSIYTADTSVIQPPVTSPRRKKMQLSPFRGLALRNTSFGWSRSCTSSIGRRTSSISTCTTVSDVTSVTSDVTFDSIETAKTEDTVDTEFCEGEQLSCSTMYPSVSTSIEYIAESCTDCYEEEQSSCSVDCSVSVSVECVVSEHSDFYGGEQFCSPADTVDIVDITCSAVVIVDTDALTLTAGMVKKKKESDWMSFLGLILLLAWAWIEYLAASKHKGLPKVKIKTLSEPEHIESRSQQIVAEISTESAYKIALFSGIGQRLEPLR